MELYNGNEGTKLLWFKMSNMLLFISVTVTPCVFTQMAAKASKQSTVAIY